MARILTLDPERARGLRKALVWMEKRRYGGAVPGITKILAQDPNIEELRSAGWDEQGIYEATALISLFNFTGRMEAASGLPMDRIPEGAQFPEATTGKQP